MKNMIRLCVLSVRWYRNKMVTENSFLHKILTHGQLKNLLEYCLCTCTKNTFDLVCRRRCSFICTLTCHCFYAFFLCLLRFNVFFFFFFLACCYQWNCGALYLWIPLCQLNFSLYFVLLCVLSVLVYFYLGALLTLFSAFVTEDGNSNKIVQFFSLWMKYSMVWHIQSPLASSRIKYRQVKKKKNNINQKLAPQWTDDGPSNAIPRCVVQKQ